MPKPSRGLSFEGMILTMAGIFFAAIALIFLMMLLSGKTKTTKEHTPIGCDSIPGSKNLETDLPEFTHRSIT